ncbi:ankyrin repeat-containing domain protein [Lentinula aciculospora]|uniref:Ankyrin repeat-containing domain protein n=1 Tax=Lentinula aciculospora TaxID=153920 RepID=A0A9W9AD78_9AGAR|nr:ankyrin repeat-containing domain protein [Lentinula aciculospora]
MTSVYLPTLSAENFGLQFLALTGDDEGVQDAIDSGANVNAIDASGRTALMCAVAGKHWSDISVAHDESFMTPSRLKVVDILLRRPEVSLSTLNAPQHAFNDATPLGMAAWLNMPEAVRLLLKSSLDSVAVDGTDMYGSTPLMYAARDGNLDIVNSLLQHGARPDLRALNNRSAIQYALSHPKVLYLCEIMLRRHRLHEWKFSKTLAEPDDLFQRAASSLPQSQTLDIPPQPIEPGSLATATDTIIECLRSDPQDLCSTLFASPSTHASFFPPLVNNRDRNGWSPIHHCASAVEPSVLVLDILYCAGADVGSFTEHEHYTALHCFAFSDHAKCPSETLYQYVYHLVHDLRAPLSARDKQGNTCIHIAAEHGQSIEVLSILLKCDTLHRVQDLCNAKGLTAWEVAKPQYRVAFGKDTKSCRPESSLSTNTLRPAHHSIESYLEPGSMANKNYISRIAISDIDVVAAAARLIDNLRISSPSIYHDTDIRHTKHLESIVVEMDQLHRIVIDYFQARIQQVSDVLKEMEGDAQDVTVLLESVAHSVNAKLHDRGLQPWTHTRMSEDSEITCVSDRLSNSSRGLKTKSSLSIPRTLNSTMSDSNGSSTANTEKVTISTTSRLVAWIKRKTSANTLAKVSSSSPTVVKKDVRTLTDRRESDPGDIMRTSIDSTLRTSGFPLSTAGRDLESLRESITSTRELLQSATRSISRADRILKRALKARRTMIKNLQKEDDLFIRGTSLSTKSSLASIASISTIASRISTGNASFSGILAESDDEETRAIRRLLLRKIDARHNGVLDEIEKIDRWLLVIKDVIQGVKRRTYV